MSTSTAPQLIYDLDHAALTDLLVSLGQPRFRADQVWHGIYQKYWNDPAQFVGLPSAMRNSLPDVLQLSSLSVSREMHSNDRQTHKYLFELTDGRFIETVWMQYRERNTLCISTQSGCAMGCAFCATGQMGFFRNLSSGEIIEQVMYFARLLQGRDEVVTNIVFMGMGEPFHNYENVMAAVDRLNDTKGFNFGARRMTISTVGLAPQIRRFAEEKRQVNLAVSLHAADDAIRAAMMPVNKKYSIDQVIEACHYYVQLTHRRITFEWALIDDVNDSDATALALAKRLKGLLCHVNLIPLNPTGKYAGKATGSDRMNQFKAKLEANGIPCSIRLRRGIDIKAGCGQLASESTTRQVED